MKPQPGKSGLVATLIAAASVVLTDTYKLAEARVLARAAAVDIDDGGEPKKAVDKGVLRDLCFHRSILWYTSTCGILLHPLPTHPLP